MSLAGCINKMGKLLDVKDVKAVKALADEIEASGVDRATAEKQAVEQHAAKAAQDTESFVQTYAQAPIEDEQGRGEIQIFDDGHVIRMTEASDMSTFLHESAHMFTSVEAKLAAKYGLVAEQQALLDSVGATSFEELTTKQHEQIAESFEVYLREGKAPSQQLMAAFDTFRVWLQRVYQDLKFLPNNKFNDDMKQVFDRWLAVDAEIGRVSADPAYQELFKSAEQAGETDAQFAERKALAANRKSKAAATLYEKLVKEISKRQRKEWATERSLLAKEEEARLSETLTYTVIEDAEKSKMRTEDVLEILGLDKHAELPSRLKKLTHVGGEPPSLLGERHGITDFNAMLMDISEAPTLAKAALDAAEARMRQKYGDIQTEIEAQAVEAMHNTQQANLLLKELKSLGKTPSVTRLTVKAEAKRLIGSLKNSEIMPEKYYRNERKAAQRAASAATVEEKAAAKQQQLANHYLYKEALQARKDIARYKKHIDSVKKRHKAKKYNTKYVDADHVHALGIVSNMYLKNRPKTPEGIAAAKADVDKALAFFETQAAVGNRHLAIHEPQLLRARAAKGHRVYDQFQLRMYSDMTVDELAGAYQTLKNIHYAGKRMMDADSIREEAAGVAEQIATVEDKSIRLPSMSGALSKARRQEPPARPDQIGDEPTSQAKRHVKSFIRTLPSLRNMVRQLDGGNETGSFFKSVWMRIQKGYDRELQLNREMFDLWESELRNLDNVSFSKRGRQTFTRADGTTFTLSSEARVMTTLYWGTEYSRDAVRDRLGNENGPATDADVMKVMESLNPDELRMVNKFWKLDDAMWPAAAEAHKARFGVVPKRVEAAPFIINGIEMTGGHTRIYYEPEAQKVDPLDSQDVEKDSFVTGSLGSMIERTDSGGRPLSLDKSNLTRNISETNHFIAFAEISREVSHIINSKKVRKAITQRHGNEFLTALKGSIASIVSGKADKVRHQTVERVFKQLRRAATYKYLYYSPRNVVQQLTVAPVVLKEVGPASYMSAVASMSTREAMASQAKMIQGKSQFMHNRASIVNREATEHVRQLAVADSQAAKAWKVVTDNGFSMQTWVDSAFAYPLWLAKYEQEIEAGKSEEVAISQADTAVSEAVGSGADLHLGGAFQSTNSELVKGITQFGTWFNSYFNRIERARIRGDKGDMIYEALFQPMIMGVMAAVVTMDLPEDQPFDEWFVDKYGGQFTGMLPIIREVYSAAQGFRSSGLMSGAAKGVADSVDELWGILDGEIPNPKKILKGVSTVVPIPAAGTVDRVWGYLESEAEGNEKNEYSFLGYIQMLVEGKDRNE